MSASPAKQKKYLDNLLRHETKEPYRLIRSLWFKAIVFVVLMSSMTAAGFLLEVGLIGPVALMMSMLALGGLIGVYSMIDASSKYWPVLKDCIDFDRVREKREDIEI